MLDLQNEVEQAELAVAPIEQPVENEMPAAHIQQPATYMSAVQEYHLCIRPLVAFYNKLASNANCRCLTIANGHHVCQASRATSTRYGFRNRMHRVNYSGMEGR